VLGTGETAGEDERLSAVGRRAAEAHVEVAVAALQEQAASESSEQANEEHEPTPAHAVAVRAARPTADDARGLISSGEAEEALRAARLALAARPRDVEFRLVEADALRALRRYAEAADAFDQAAVDAGPGSRLGAGYRAAVIRRRNLGDPDGALASLDVARVDAEGSPFEERGLALRARALLALGREADARIVAERYLARYPTGSTRSFMEQLARVSEEDDPPR